MFSFEKMTEKKKVCQFTLNGILFLTFGKTSLLISYLFCYKTVFSFQNNAKNLDPSFKMDLDLWDCLGKTKLVFSKIS